MEQYAHIYYCRVDKCFVAEILPKRQWKDGFRTRQAAIDFVNDDWDRYDGE